MRTFLLFVLLFLLPHVARARVSADRSRPSAPDLRTAPSSARKLIATAERALQAGERSTGRAALLAALRLWPAAPVLVRLGTVFEAEGAIVRAQDCFRRALADGGELLTDPQRAAAERALQRPRPPSGELQIIGPRRAEVLVQGELVGRLPLLTPLLLPMGSQDVVVRTPKKSLASTATIRPGRRLLLRFDLTSGAVLSTWSPTVILLFEGDARAPERMAGLRAAAVRAVADRQFDVLDRDTALVAAPSLSHCLERLTCQADLAIQNGVDYALVLRIEEPDPLRLRLVARLVDARMGDVATEASRPCPGCGRAAAETALGEVLAEAFGGMSRPRGLLEVASTPPGARLLLDGRQVGITPHRRTAWAGRSHLTLLRDGYLPHQQDLQIPEGRTLSLDIVLVQQVRARPPTQATESSAASR